MRRWSLDEWPTILIEDDVPENDWMDPVEVPDDLAARYVKAKDEWEFVQDALRDLLGVDF